MLQRIVGSSEVVAGCNFVQTSLQLYDSRRCIDQIYSNEKHIIL